MPRPHYTFCFDYESLGRVVGRNPVTVRSHRSHGLVNPDDLESLVCYVAKYAPYDLKVRMLKWATETDLDELVKNDKRNRHKTQRRRERLRDYYGDEIAEIAETLKSNPGLIEQTKNYVARKRKQEDQGAE